MHLDLLHSSHFVTILKAQNDISIRMLGDNPYFNVINHLIQWLMLRRLETCFGMEPGCVWAFMNGSFHRNKISLIGRRSILFITFLTFQTSKSFSTNALKHNIWDLTSFRCTMLCARFDTPTVVWLVCTSH